MDITINIFNCSKKMDEFDLVLEHYNNQHPTKRISYNDYAEMILRDHLYHESRKIKEEEEEE